MWTVCTALPGLAIAILLIMRSNGWLLDASAPIELALIVLALVAVVLGLRAMILAAMSISDPVSQVVDAMADVEKGQIDRTIDVYEWSEIGRLQSGFNRMVAGLRERDRLRDLFGRHVGEEVARRAVEQNASPGQGTNVRWRCCSSTWPTPRSWRSSMNPMRWHEYSTSSSRSWSPPSTSGTV
ncbi:MAG: HAMP domain-containing protein [Mycobacterium sp.]